MIKISQKTKYFITYTLVISGSFCLGIFIYSSYAIRNVREVEAVNLREYGPILLKTAQNNFIMKADGKDMIIKSSDLNTWLETYIRNYSGKEDLRISSAKITEYLESLAPHLNIEPINARFTFKNSRAEVFVPSTRGRRLNISSSAAAITSSLLENKSSTSLDFDIIEPEITLDKINNLGIKILLGRGESDYGKSSSARIHNIKLGMSKFNGAILKPGEIFSFNNLLGEVDENSGYLAELVIKNGSLVREFGGGLCQVATTIFRGAILAGLEIKERKPHSFPVQYYNPQGFDATIYPGIVDLKFKNTTNSHILIQTRLVGNRLLAEIYGSNEDTRVELDGPHQYAQQPSGAMKAYFVRKIYRGKELEKEERFDSIYKAPPPSPLERNPLE